MDYNVYLYIKSRPDLINFIRVNPIWYRYLSRDPKAITEMESEAKMFYGKTISQRLNKINDHIQLIAMVSQFTEAMKD